MAESERPAWSDAYDEGYEAGKNAALVNAYVKGYHDGFTNITEAIKRLIEREANSAIPARTDGCQAQENES